MRKSREVTNGAFVQWDAIKQQDKINKIKSVHSYTKTDGESVDPKQSSPYILRISVLIQ
jgi:hypothetical protein